MPIYEYECSHCRYYLEVIQKLSDARLKKCPSCGKNALKKLISAPVFRLKGSGWYETDFKSDQEHKRNLVGGEKEAASGDAKDAKDAKAAGAADAGVDTKAGAPSEAKSDTAGDGKASAKTEPTAAKPEAARAKDPASGRSSASTRKSHPAKPAPKAKPAAKRASAKSPPKAAKRRGRR